MAQVTTLQLPLEIRWHGRGGQGVVTGSRLLATAALKAGLYPQSLPDFGAERSGAPIAAYTRIDRVPPVLRGPVEEPNLVVVVDPTLIGSIPVTAGLTPDGTVIVNTIRSAEEIAERLDVDRAQVWCVDAHGISTRILGKRLPNAPLLGALVRAVPVVPVEDLEMAFRGQASLTFTEKVIEANIQALNEGYESARSAGGRA